MEAAELDPDVCYRALQTRDGRFDGRFFVAVRSTGIYCRPVCPARTPRRENCWFVRCAAAAQEAGFRPCLRCRPEAAPGTPAWQGTSATVSRALALIEAGALDGGRGVEALAMRLGVGGRHLRRLFLRHLGATPVAVAQTRRVLFAKKLLDETALPMAEVASAAGFASLRRFNDAMRSVYARPPSALRRADGELAGSELSLRLPYRAPLDWSALLAFLALRAIPGVEMVSGNVYRRTVRLGEARGVVEVAPIAGEAALRARIWLSRSAPLAPLAARLRRLFDLGADPSAIAEQLGKQPGLRRAVRARPGLRVPGAWCGFELAVRAILGQQVSVVGATTLAGRLVERFGEPLACASEAGSELRFLFPPAAVLAEADLTRIGLPGARARAANALAAAVATGGVWLDGSEVPEETIAKLEALPGVGPWTAQYVAMRALGQPDAFPASDLGLRRALGHGRPVPSARELEGIAEAWRPWRAYAALHLWSAHSSAERADQKARSRTVSGPRK